MRSKRAVWWSWAAHQCEATTTREKRCRALLLNPEFKFKNKKSISSFVCFPGLKGNLALCIPILTYFISVIGTRSPSFPSLQSSKQVHSRMRIRPHPPSFTLPVPWGGEIITSTLRKHQYFTFNELGRPNYLSRLLISEIVKYGCGFDGNRVISEMGISDTQSIK